MSFVVRHVFLRPAIANIWHGPLRFRGIRRIRAKVNKYSAKRTISTFDTCSPCHSLYLGMHKNRIWTFQVRSQCCVYHTLFKSNLFIFLLLNLYVFFLDALSLFLVSTLIAQRPLEYLLLRRWKSETKVDLEWHQRNSKRRHNKISNAPKIDRKKKRKRKSPII